jgi:HK97 gp10 family phage protein
MRVRIEGISDITKTIRNEVRTVIANAAQDVQDSAKTNTPIRTGNARRNWRKQVSEDKFTVENRVPYIERLEAGASRQAPRGIVRPTLTQIKGKYK